MTFNEFEMTQHKTECAMLLSRCMQAYYDENDINPEGNEELSLATALYLLKHVIGTNIDTMDLEVSKKEFLNMNIELVVQNLEQLATENGW